MNYQTTFLTECILQELENNLIYVDEHIDIEDIVLSKLSRLTLGEYAVIEIDDGKFSGLSKLDSLSDSFNINSESIIISYKKLDEAFHEQLQYERKL